MPVKWNGVRKKAGPVKTWGRVERLAKRREKQRQVMARIRAIKEEEEKT